MRMKGKIALITGGASGLGLAMAEAFMGQGDRVAVCDADPAAVEAVRAGRFFIYQVAHVTEGIHILTGVPTGTADETGAYPAESVYGRIQSKLKSFRERARELKPAGGALSENE